MAEEAKQAEQQQQPQEKKSGAEVFKKILKVIVGIILILGGAFLCWHWWHHLRDLIKGAIGPFLILVGLITVAIARD